MSCQLLENAEFFTPIVLIVFCQALEVQFFYTVSIPQNFCLPSYYQFASSSLCVSFAIHLLCFHPFLNVALSTKVVSYFFNLMWITFVCCEQREIYFYWETLIWIYFTFNPRRWLFGLSGQNTCVVFWMLIQ